MPRLDSPRLTLVPHTAALLRADLEGPVALERALGVAVPPGWPPELYDADAQRWSLARLEERPTDRDWVGHYVVRRQAEGAPELLIGVAGFKGGPDADGAVELGYSIMAAHQRRGYATEAVRTLCAFAFGMPGVRTVMAHTLTTLSPSIGVLEKAGFHFVGEAHDDDAPAGATVVRYAIHRA